VVYIDNQEVIRQNLPSGPLDHTTQALTPASAPLKDFYALYSLEIDELIKGKHVLAVALFHSNETVPNLTFDMELFGISANGFFPTNDFFLALKIFIFIFIVIFQTLIIDLIVNLKMNAPHLMLARLKRREIILSIGLTRRLLSPFCFLQFLIFNSMFGSGTMCISFHF